MTIFGNAQIPCQRLSCRRLLSDSFWKGVWLKQTFERNLPEAAAADIPAVPRGHPVTRKLSFVQILENVGRAGNDLTGSRIEAQRVEVREFGLIPIAPYIEDSSDDPESSLARQHSLNRMEDGTYSKAPTAARTTGNRNGPADTPDAQPAFVQSRVTERLIFS